MNRDELLHEIREAADMVDSEFISDETLDGWVDTSLRQLQFLLVERYGAEYWAKHTWIQVRPGSDPTVAWPRPTLNPESEIPGPDTGYSTSYSLPDEFNILVRCSFVEGTVTRVTGEVGTTSSHEVRRTDLWQVNTSNKLIYPMHALETPTQLMSYDPADWIQHEVGYRLRHGPINAFSLSGYDGATPVYTIANHMGAAIEFLPVPKSYYAVQVTYVPAPSLLPNHPHIGYVVADCAAQCLEKQGSDSSFQRQRQALEAKLLETSVSSPRKALPNKIRRVNSTNNIGAGSFPRWPYR